MSDLHKRLIKKIKDKRETDALLFDALSPYEQKIHTGRKNFIIDNISAYIIVSISAGSYLAGLLQYAGVPNQINGIILSLPVLAGMFQIFGSVLSQHFRTQKRFIMIGVIAHRLCLSILFVYPLIFGATILCAVMIVLTYSIGYFLGSLAGPASSNWIISFVPEKMRGDYFSRRERYSLIAVALATVFVSIILDKTKALNIIAAGFAIVGLILLVVSIFDIISVARIFEPDIGYVKDKFKWKSVLEPFWDKKFFKVIVIFILWQTATQISVPFLGIYYVSEIKISYTIIGLITMLATAEKAIIVSRWGKFADRTSWDYVLKIAVVVFAGSQVVQIFLSRENYLWLFPVIALTSNVAWSVLGISMLNIQFQFLNHEKAIIYIGVCGTISGFIGFGAALAGSKILTVVNDANLMFNGYQVQIALSALIAFALAYYMHISIQKPGRDGGLQD
ncbi:MAG: MFS transporter [Saccharofermentanales bacterium]